MQICLEENVDDQSEDSRIKADSIVKGPPRANLMIDWKY